jgi:hypothetical protein
MRYNYEISRMSKGKFYDGMSHIDPAIDGTIRYFSTVTGIAAIRLPAYFARNLALQALKGGKAVLTNYLAKHEVWGQLCAKIYMALPTRPGGRLPQADLSE